MHDFAVILAGGRGTRMNRLGPKSLEKICGKPLISHIIDTLEKRGLEIYIVVSPNSPVRELGVRYRYVTQLAPLGTGDALRLACRNIPKYAKKVLVVNGDGPIFDVDLLDKMLTLGKNAMNILVKKMYLKNSFGRILRDEKGAICNIKEAKDCSNIQLKISETNVGLYCIKTESLRRNIEKIIKNNAQNEYYATDLVKFVYQDGGKIGGIDCENFQVFDSVNTVAELTELDNTMQHFIQQKLGVKGVRFIGQSYVESTSIIGASTTIYPNCYIGGRTKIGANCIIYPNCTLININIPNNTIIPPGTTLIF